MTRTFISPVTQSAHIPLETTYLLLIPLVYLPVAEAAFEESDLVLLRDGMEPIGEGMGWDLIACASLGVYATEI